MRDVLPEGIYNYVRDRYLAGTSDALAHFNQHMADEDSLTGALGEAIAAGPVTYRDDSGEYHVEISYRKLRGRGFGAPEKRFGADGVFQIHVSDREGRIVRQKALPFQTKKAWRRTNSKLVAQCEDMLRHLGQGLVIDFSREKYSAVDASEVIEARGRPESLRNQERLRDLGHVLADEFLPCQKGIPNLFYDPDQEQFATLPIGAPLPLHALTTVVRRLE